MAFYFAGDGTVDVAVAFEEDAEARGFALLQRLLVVNDTVNINSHRPIISAGTELFQPYSQQVTLEVEPLAFRGFLANWSELESPQGPLENLLPIDGTLAADEGVDTASVSVSLIYSASLAAVEELDSATFLGSQIFSGTFSVTEAVDVAAFMGSVVNPSGPITGAMVVNEQTDGFSATIIAVFGAISGNWTEAGSVTSGDWVQGQSVVGNYSQSATVTGANWSNGLSASGGDWNEAQST